MEKLRVEGIPAAEMRLVIDEKRKKNMKRQVRRKKDDDILVETIYSMEYEN